MRSPLARRLLSAAVVVVFFAPVAWTRQTCADDWADETSPTDNPGTPAPDLYANKRFEDGVTAMPDLSPSTPARDVVEIVPTGHSRFFSETLNPQRTSFDRLFSGSPRPPRLSRRLTSSEKCPHVLITSVKTKKGRTHETDAHC